MAAKSMSIQPSGMSEMAGSRPDLVVHAVLDMAHDLKCPICLELLKDPAQLPCCHFFCWDCIHELLKRRDHTKCPVCKARSKRRDIARSELMRNLTLHYQELHGCALAVAQRQQQQQEQQQDMQADPQAQGAAATSVGIQPLTASKAAVAAACQQVVEASDVAQGPVVNATQAPIPMPHSCAGLEGSETQPFFTPDNISTTPPAPCNQGLCNQPPQCEQPPVFSELQHAPPVDSAAGAASAIMLPPGSVTGIACTACAGQVSAPPCDTIQPAKELHASALLAAGEAPDADNQHNSMKAMAAARGARGGASRNQGSLASGRVSGPSSGKAPLLLHAQHSTHSTHAVVQLPAAGRRGRRPATRKAHAMRLGLPADGSAAIDDSDHISCGDTEDLARCMPAGEGAVIQGTGAASLLVDCAQTADASGKLAGRLQGPCVESSQPQQQQQQQQQLMLLPQQQVENECPEQPHQRQQLQQGGMQLGCEKGEWQSKCEMAMTITVATSYKPGINSAVAEVLACSQAAAAALSRQQQVENAAEQCGTSSGGCVGGTGAPSSHETHLGAAAAVDGVMNAVHQAGSGMHTGKQAAVDMDVDCEVKEQLQLMAGLLSPGVTGTVVIGVTPGPGDSKQPVAMGRRVPTRLLPWACPRCTLHNAAGARKCTVCKAPRPADAALVTVQDMSYMPSATRSGSRKRASSAEPAGQGINVQGQRCPLPTPKRLAGIDRRSSGRHDSSGNTLPASGRNAPCSGHEAPTGAIKSAADNGLAHTARVSDKARDSGKTPGGLAAFPVCDAVTSDASDQPAKGASTGRDARKAGKAAGGSAGNKRSRAINSTAGIMVTEQAQAAVVGKNASEHVAKRGRNSGPAQQGNPTLMDFRTAAQVPVRAGGRSRKQTAKVTKHGGLLPGPGDGSTSLAAAQLDTTKPQVASAAAAPHSHGKQPEYKQPVGKQPVGKRVCGRGHATSLPAQASCAAPGDAETSLKAEPVAACSKEAPAAAAKQPKKGQMPIKAKEYQPDPDATLTGPKQRMPCGGTAAAIGDDKSPIAPSGLQSTGLEAGVAAVQGDSALAQVDTGRTRRHATKGKATKACDMMMDLHMAAADAKDAAPAPTPTCDADAAKGAAAPAAAGSMAKRGTAAAAGLCKGTVVAWTGAAHWVLLGSGLTDAGKAALKQLSSLSGCQVTDTWSSAVTHVVCGTDAKKAARRTIKYLMGIAHGCWVVDVEWVQACLASGKVEPMQQYEIASDQAGGFGGASLGRAHAHKKSTPQLLAGISILLAGPFASKADITALAKSVGASILQRPPLPAAHQSDDQAGYYAHEQRGKKHGKELDRSRAGSKQATLACTIFGEAVAQRGGGSSSSNASSPQHMQTAKEADGPKAYALLDVECCSSKGVQPSKAAAAATAAGMVALNYKWLLDCVGSWTRAPLADHGLPQLVPPLFV